MVILWHLLHLDIIAFRYVINTCIFLDALETPRKGIPSLLVDRVQLPHPVEIVRSQLELLAVLIREASSEVGLLKD